MGRPRLPAAPAALPPQREEKASAASGFSFPARLHVLGIGLLLLMILFALYIPVLRVGFFSDDLLLTVIAPRDPVALFQSAEGLLHYRPLSMSLFWLIWRAFGFQGAIFHFFTLSVYLLNVSLLYPLLRRLSIPRAPAWSATALFGLLPFAHEAIAFVMGSVHSFALVWMLSATALALRPGRPPQWGRSLLALGAYLAAILSHETGIVWPALLLLLERWRPGRFPGLRSLILAGFALGAGYMLFWWTRPRGDPGVLAQPIFTLESSLYAVQGWLHPLGPALRPLWEALFGPRPILLRALRPGDWAFLGLGLGVTAAMMAIARPRGLVALGLGWFAISIAPSLLFWGPASGMMNYPRMLVIPGVGSAMAWAAVVEGARRRGAVGCRLAGAGLGVTLLVSILVTVASLGYYLDATRILQGMAVAAREAGNRPILYVNLPYNVGYRWFRARFYPYPYGGAGAVLVTDERSLAGYIRLNGGPDLTDWPLGRAESRHLEALYPNWFIPAPPIDFHGLRDALKDHAVYVFREDLTWVPLYEIWQVQGTSDRKQAEALSLEILDPTPRFDERIALRGWRIDREAGELILAWEALAPPERRWHVFVHLLDEKGGLLGQADGPMAGGLAPTDAWRTGDWVIDRRPLPKEVQPAALRLGLYDLTSGERATVEWEGLRPPDRYVVLPASR
ncbi:MAG: hypothetical protein J7452_04385 [Thermoflexus sp.]|jgi:hypothetical protein|nr:hypothetical protein [Thermoflexus sp.]